MSGKRSIVILGGGTAGWMTAAALAKFVPASQYTITLVSSAEIGTVGVGEATIPHIRQFNELLGIDENTFINAVGATYKLAIRFQGWGEVDSDYCHGFGYSGEEINGIEFHHYYLKAGGSAKLGAYDNFNLAACAARSHRFAYPLTDTNDARSRYGYAFHIDATAYAAYLKQYAQSFGVRHIEGEITAAKQHADGSVGSLFLSDGMELSGELFIDCSGFRGRLIEQVLGSGYENWQHWLPCDSAQAVASPAMENPPTYTLSQAHQAGWRWQIPLQHRTGNGIVYASQWMSDTAASDMLLSATNHNAEGDPKQLRFTTGKRSQSWVKNCIAIGLSSGFLEPLESTSLYLIQAAIEKLIEYFPASCEHNGARQAFNRYIDTEYERVRDFLILHYHLNNRTEPFWQSVATMSLPDSLNTRLEQYKESGYFNSYRQGLFMPVSWATIALGQGMDPKNISSRISNTNGQTLESSLAQYASQLSSWVEKMPSHVEALNQAKANNKHYPPASSSLYGGNR